MRKGTFENICMANGGVRHWGRPKDNAPTLEDSDSTQHTSVCYTNVAECHTTIPLDCIRWDCETW